MTQQGATLYYISKHVFNFDRIYGYLKESGFLIKHPDTQLITGLAEEGDLNETSLEKVKELILNQDDIGIHLWLENGQKMFWSFSTYGNYFSYNFDFISLLDSDQIEEEISPFFIKLALSELYIEENNFLGFTLDQYGNSEWNDFGEIFDRENKNILNHSYISEITFLPKNMISKITLDNKSRIININKNFDCIARDEKLAASLEGKL